MPQSKQFFCLVLLTSLSCSQSRWTGELLNPVGVVSLVDMFSLSVMVGGNYIIKLKFSKSNRK
jgi:hypothetical protein